MTILLCFDAVGWVSHRSGVMQYVHVCGT